MEKIFENKRYTTIIIMREITNCISGEKSKFPNEYFVYDNIKECNVIIHNFYPTCYNDIRNKAIELNNALIQSTKNMEILK